MAFGGVATGNMKAQLAARATGIANCATRLKLLVPSGNKFPSTVAKIIIMGTKVAVVAWLLVSSVRKTIRITINNINNTALISGIRPPIHLPKPELMIAFAIDKPPPNKIKIPQGSFVVLLHSIRPEPWLDLVMNTASAAIIAIP